MGQKYCNVQLVGIASIVKAKVHLPQTYMYISVVGSS